MSARIHRHGNHGIPCESAYRGSAYVAPPLCGFALSRFRLAMSFWDTLGWGGSDAGWDTGKGDPSWGSSDAGWGGMGTGKGGPSWGSSDAGGDGSCSGKGTGMGTGKGGPTGEYSHGWGSSDAGWDGSCVLGVRQCAWRKCHAELRLGMEPLSG